MNEQTWTLCWECNQVGIRLATGECENPMCRSGLNYHWTEVKAWERAREEAGKEAINRAQKSSYVLANRYSDFERANAKPVLAANQYQPTLARAYPL